MNTRWLALLLSLAVGCSGGGAALDGSLGEPSASRTDGLARPEKAPVRRGMDLEAFMKNDLNGALTRASFALFHADRAPAEPAEGDPFENLLAATQRLSTYESWFEHDLPAYQNHAASLRLATRAFVEAASQGAVEEARHWLNHVRATCNSCHMEFRD
jgi:hypothetical protein